MLFDDLLQLRKGGPDMTRGTGPTMLSEAVDLEEWQLKVSALRDLVKLILGKEPNGYHTPLAPKTEMEELCNGYIKRTVSYNLGPEERIRAHLLIPVNKPFPRPAILTIHQTTPQGKEQTIGKNPSSQAQSFAYGLHLVQQGYITLSYDLLGANERNYPGYESFSTEPFYQQFPDWSVRGKDIWDVSRAIDFLETVSEVDTSRIGSIGHSQGGGITIDAMGLEPRIKVGVSNCGDWPGKLMKNPFARARTGWWIGTPNLRPFCWCGKNYPIDLHEKLALIAPRPLLMITALNDWNYGIDEESVTRPGFENLAMNVRKVYSIYKASENFESILHLDGHSFPDHIRQQAYGFFDRFL